MLGSQAADKVAEEERQHKAAEEEQQRQTATEAKVFLRGVIPLSYPRKNIPRLMMKSNSSLP